MRYTTVNTTVSTTVIPRIQIRSSPMMIPPPKGSTAREGRNWATGRKSEDPKRCFHNSRPSVSTPSVAMIRTNGDDRRNGVITARFTMAPAAAPAATPTTTAVAVPSESRTSVNTPAPVSANTP